MWIKLHRQLLKWEWFQNPEMVQFLIYLLLNANYEESKWRGETILRGQLITTITNIQKDLGLSAQQVRTCITRLKSTGEITVKTTNRFSIITICNYDSYQDSKTTEQQTNQQTSQQSSNTPYITEYKEYNNISNSITCAYAMDSLEQCFNELSSDKSWLESVLYHVRSLGHKQVFDLTEYLQLFFSKLRSEGETFKDLRDAKHHFSNWITIYLKQQKNETNRSANQVSRKQEANDYLLNKFVTNYSTVDDEVPKPF